MIYGISKKPPEDQQLVFQKEHKILEDHKTLGDYGITSQTAKAQSPAVLAVAYKKDGMELFYNMQAFSFVLKPFKFSFCYIISTR